MATVLLLFLLCAQPVPRRAASTSSGCDVSIFGRYSTKADLINQLSSPCLGVCRHISQVMFQFVWYVFQDNNNQYVNTHSRTRSQSVFGGNSQSRGCSSIFSASFCAVRQTFPNQDSPTLSYMLASCQNFVLLFRVSPTIPPVKLRIASLYSRCFPLHCHNLQSPSRSRHCLYFKMFKYHDGHVSSSPLKLPTLISLFVSVC